MTIRRDYLLRLIDEFFKFLAKIMQLKSDKQYDQALALIDEASQALLHKDLNELLEDDDAVAKITEDKLLNLDQVEVLGGLLKVKADINNEMYNRFTAISLYEKSLFLLNHVESVSKNFSMDRLNKIKEISDALFLLKA